MGSGRPNGREVRASRRGRERQRLALLNSDLSTDHDGDGKDEFDIIDETARHWLGDRFPDGVAA